MLMRWCSSRRDYLLLLSVACTCLIVTVTWHSSGSIVELGEVGPAANTFSDLITLQQTVVEVKECGCRKKVLASPAESGSEILVLANTTCSEAAFHLGSVQNVFAFAFYEGEADRFQRDYFAGIR